MIVVPDSNIFIAQVIPLEYTEAAEHKLNQWLESGLDPWVLQEPRDLDESNTT